MFYIYNSRFQPFNNENLAEMEWLFQELKGDDKIIFGIVNYSPHNPDTNDHIQTLERFQIEYNPLSYSDCELTIKLKEYMIYYS